MATLVCVAMLRWPRGWMGIFSSPTRPNTHHNKCNIRTSYMDSRALGELLNRLCVHVLLLDGCCH
eukprot:4564751-Lingulodinium_polyedra.AAC.1